MLKAMVEVISFINGERKTSEASNEPRPSECIYLHALYMVLV